MFLESDITGSDGLSISYQDGMKSTPMQQKISPTLSHTGNYERRTMIRQSGVNTLVQDHNLLLNAIVIRGSISTYEKSILLSMEQEGIHLGGEFYGKIKENNPVHTISHQEGMSQYNTLQGTTHVLRGTTKLRVWSLVQD